MENNYRKLEMIVRIEKTKDWTKVLVVDELDKFLGVISLGTFHKLCREREETLEMDDYTYYYVNKQKLIKYLKCGN